VRLPRLTAGSRRAVTDELAELDEFLDDIFGALERLSRRDIQRRAIAADLSPEALTRIDALPEGEYAQDEAAEALRAVQI